MDYAFRLVWSCLLNEQCVNIHDTSIIIFTLEPISSHSSSDRISDQISDSSNQSKVRLNVTSTTDLFTYAKKQSSLHSKLSRIDHPMSPSNRSQGSLVATIDHDSKMQISIPMKNIPTRPKSRDLQPFIDGLNHTIRSKYEDLWVERIKVRILFVFSFRVNIWRQFFLRLSNFHISPIDTRITHSWSTMTPSEMFDIIQSDDIGPWWSRRDVHDRTPAIFILINEPFCE